MAGQLLDGELSRVEIAQLRFSTAGAADDAAIRRLLRDNPMRGGIDLTFEREPDYFLGADIGGATDRTVLAYSDGRLACMGRCSTHGRWVNGRATRTGYLGELRLDAGAQGRFDILRKGYRFFHELHLNDPAEFYFTSITADNERAIRLLESGRSGLPGYTFLSEFVTLLIAVPRNPHGGKLRFEKGTPARVPEIVSFLNRCGRRHQLATEWTEKDLVALARHGLPPERFHIVFDGGSIVACGVFWDQREFRQTVIRGYAPALAAGRRLINLAGRIAGTPRLPAPGSVLAHAFLSPFAFEENCGFTLPDLVATFFPVAAQTGIEFLTLGLPASHPGMAALKRRFSTRTYRSRIYGVTWAGEKSALFDAGNHLFLPEVALL